MATVDIDLGAYKLGWHDVEDNEFKPAKGLNESIIRQMSEMKNEPQVDARFPAEGLPAVSFASRSRNGVAAARSTTSTSTTSTTTSSLRVVSPRTGTWSPNRSSRPTRSSGFPRPNASTSPG